jgi:hypothetical protein
VLRSVFSPTSAYQQDPGARGFIAMHYQQSTEDIVSFPNGIVPLYMNVRPAAPVRFSMQRDRQDTAGTVSLKHGIRPVATPWAVDLTAKDPRVYVDPDQSFAVAGTPGSGTGTAINRGDYETPLNIMLVVGSGGAVVGEFRLKGFNGIDMRIKIESKPNTVYRWFGDDRVLMTEDITGGQGINPLVLRMDLVTFATKQRKPMVPASINPPSKPFSTSFSWWRTNSNLAAGSRIFWSEAFA